MTNPSACLVIVQQRAKLNDTVNITVMTIISHPDIWSEVATVFMFGKFISNKLLYSCD